MSYPSLFDRLAAHILIDELGCWTWTAGTRRHSGCARRPAVTLRVPGQLNPRRKNAARVMCEIIHGPAPGPEYDASHLCRDNILCICPDHVLWETKRENQARRWREQDPDIETRGMVVEECPF